MLHWKVRLIFVASVLLALFGAHGKGVAPKLGFFWD